MSRHRHSRRQKSRREGRPTSLKAKLAGGGVALLLAVPTVAVSLATSHGNDENDTVAADYASVSQAAAVIAAEQRFNDGDLSGAERFASEALAVSPISPAALRVLALSEQKLNNNARAGALMSQAAALGWRDAPTQLWLTAAFLQSKDYASAAARIDAVLRLNPYADVFYGLVDTGAKDPMLVRELVGRLTLNPDWRTPYLTSQSNSAPDAARSRAALLLGLMRTPAPPIRSEVVGAVKLLRTASLPDEARNLWLVTNNTPAGTNLYDGNFQDTQITPVVLYQWNLNPNMGVAVNAEQHPGVKGMALHVNSDGTGSAVVAQQTTQLAPGGSYHLRLQADGNRQALGIYSWVVHCAIGSGGLLLSLPATSAAAGSSFTVPAGCPLQTVELHAQSGMKGAEAWFSNASIS